jgi:uncharacterized protein YkwD
MGVMPFSRNALARWFAPSLCLLAIGLLGGPAEAQAGCANSQQASANLSKDQARAAVQCLLNQERGKNVEQNNDLDKAAQNHSAVMANLACLSHQCPGEPDLKTRVKRTGYSNSPVYGEVVASFYEQDSPKAVVNAWMNSPDHRAIIQRSSYDHVGVGVSFAGRLAYYTAVFAHR